MEIIINLYLARALMPELGIMINARARDND